MTPWLLYAIAVALLLSSIAWRLERWISSRWIWLAALTGSVVVPLLSVPALPQQVKLGWCMLSCGVLLYLLTGSVRLFFHRRRWQRTTLLGVTVYLSGGIGPCVAGYVRPCIVMPVWLRIIPPPQQALMLARQQCLLAARDPQLLALAYALIVLMPWNMALWWQVHRLRFAIEVDADARMLAQGHDHKAYALMLRQSGMYYSSLTGSSALVLKDPRALRRRRRSMAARAANLL